MSNHPFIKANYPHHEGIWGWEQAADQVVMMVRNIRRSMVEYHDILWDIGYAKTWDEATLNLDNLYSERPPMEDFLEWRDLRVMDEIYWVSRDSFAIATHHHHKICSHHMFTVRVVYRLLDGRRVNA